MADKMLDKISKVLNQAENAATPEEAAAFMQKAQELASINAIDLAVARSHQADKEKRQEVEERRVRMEPTWRATATTKWKTELFLAVARVNDCKCLIGGKGISVFPSGFPGDLDVTEALFNSLVVQMVASCDEALKRGDHKEKKRVYKRVRVEIPEDERAWGEQIDDRAYMSDRCYARSQEDHDRWPDEYPLPPKYRLDYAKDEDGNRIIEVVERSVVDGRVFRANFYEGFIARVTSRLWEAKRTAEAQYNKNHDIAEDSEDSSALVLRNKREEVQAFFDQKLVGIKGTYKGAETTRHSSHGQSAGRHAGANARIGSEVELTGGARREIG